MGNLSSNGHWDDPAKWRPMVVRSRVWPMAIEVLVLWKDIYHIFSIFTGYYPRPDHVHMPFEIEREEVTLRSLGFRVESPPGWRFCVRNGGPWARRLDPNVGPSSRNVRDQKASLSVKKRVEISFNNHSSV